MYIYGICLVQVFNTSNTYIQGPGYIIIISFTQFSTESNYDFVRIYSCPDSTCAFTTQLGSLSGTYSTPQSFTSITGYMLVQFTSDNVVPASGWLVKQLTELAHTEMQHDTLLKSNLKCTISDAAFVIHKYIHTHIHTCKYIHAKGVHHGPP